MSDIKQMSVEQEMLFANLNTFQKKLAPLILEEVSPLDAYRRIKPDSTNSDIAARSIVSRSMKSIKMTTFINSVSSKMISDAIMTRKEALERLTVFARANLGEMVDFKTVIYKVDEREVKQATWSLKDSSTQNPNHLAAISELSTSSQGIKVKLHSASDAIKQLAAMQGWNQAEKVDHTSSDGTMTPKGSSLDVSNLSTELLTELMKIDDESKSHTLRRARD